MRTTLTILAVILCCCVGACYGGCGSAPATPVVVCVCAEPKPKVTAQSTPREECTTPQESHGMEL